MQLIKNNIDTEEANLDITQQGQYPPLLALPGQLLPATGQSDIVASPCRPSCSGQAALRKAGIFLKTGLAKGPL